MSDKRKKDRRQVKKRVKKNRRKGPRRLTCTCGGKVEVMTVKKGDDLFVCVRCGKKYC